MSLRDEILEILADPRLSRQTNEYTLGLIMCRIENEQARASSAVVLDETLVGRPSGIEQGITRLAMISFAAGEWSTVWNGTPGPNQWVRYRGHHVSRGSYPDGTRFSIQFRAHDGEREATFEPRRTATMTEAALLLVADIDDLLDTVIEENGVPGDEVPDAEVVERVDGDTARRVINSWNRWIIERVARGMAWEPTTILDKFVAAIDRGEVEP